MSPGLTFERVYRDIKAQLTGGQLAPGEPLEPRLLGEALNASITPVRDALHRLLGERLVEAPRHNGFRVPAPTEAQLRDLYGWTGKLLELALRGPPGRARTGPPETADAASRPPGGIAPEDPAGLFEAIAAIAESGEQLAAVRNLNDRLGAARSAEARLFGDLAAELAALAAALGANDRAVLRTGLRRYHRRRQRHAPDILLVMQARLPEA